MLLTQTTGSALTSMKIGGPVPHFCQPTDLSELAEAFAYSRESHLPAWVIGGGSNLIMPDAEFSGLLIRPLMRQLALLGRDGELDRLVERWRASRPAASRYAAAEGEGFLSLTGTPAVQEGEVRLVEMGAAVPWGQAVSWTLRQNLAGLHWFARIPCSVGGAAYNNIHGERHFFSEHVCAVRAFDPQSGQVRTYAADELEFGYDHSLFHRIPRVIVSVILALPEVGAEEAAACQKLYLDWTQKKARVQPSGANCGSVFKNLDAAEAEATGKGMVAAAWYIDQCGLKGQELGGLQVYPGHANFIINRGEGTQAQFIQLVGDIRQEVFNRFGHMLEPEVECINERGERLIWRKNESTGSY